MIKTLVYMGLGFGIFATGMWLGVTTERKRQRHMARRARTIHPCRTYTTAANNVNVTWGEHA